MRRTYVAVLGAVALLLATGATGTTWATLSDHDAVAGNRIATATVVVGGSGTRTPDLRFVDLEPEESVKQTLRLSYSGTIRADLVLVLAPGASPAFCTEGPDGQWRSAEGGALELYVRRTGWVDYCSLLDVGREIVLARRVPPGALRDITVRVRLGECTDPGWSELTSTDQLRVLARQSRGASFTDHVTGTVAISLGTVPELPPGCPEAGDVADPGWAETGRRTVPRMTPPASSGRDADDSATNGQSSGPASPAPSGDSPGDDATGNGDAPPADDLPEDEPPEDGSSPPPPRSDPPPPVDDPPADPGPSDVLGTLGTLGTAVGDVHGAQPPGQPIQP